MPLRIGKVLDAKFTNISGSDFAIICQDRKFEVHELILREYGYFDKIFEGKWKEAGTRELHIETTDKVLVEAMIKHIYGASENEVLECLSRGFINLQQEAQANEDADLLEEAQDIVQAFVTPDEGVWGNMICPSNTDPLPWQSRAAVHTLVRLVRFYGLAIQFDLQDLKKLLLQRFTSLLNTAWNHSDILSVIHAIFSEIPEGEPMFVLLFREIELRIQMLVSEPNFIAFVKMFPELHLKIGDMTMRKLAERPQRGGRKYCHRSDDKTGFYCRYNTRCHRPSKGTKLTHILCDNCGQAYVETTWRSRLWQAEDVRESAKRAREDSSGSDLSSDSGVDDN